VGQHLQRAAVFLFGQLRFHIIQELNYKPIGADVKCAGYLYCEVSLSWLLRDIDS